MMEFPYDSSFVKARFPEQQPSTYFAWLFDTAARKNVSFFFKKTSSCHAAGMKDSSARWG